MTSAEPHPFTVLIVGMSGTFTAPVAERILCSLLRERSVAAGVIDVQSAGLEEPGGREIEPQARVALESHQCDRGPYVSQQVSAELLERADMVITGREAVRSQLVARFPAVERITFTMSEIGHLYAEVAAMAPLVEHARMLNAARQNASVADNYDLSSDERTPAAVDEMFAKVERSCHWLAKIWVSMAPGVGDESWDSDSDQQSVDIDAFGVAVRVVCDGDDPARLAAAVRAAFSRTLATSPREPESIVHLAVRHDAEDRTWASSRGWTTYRSVPEALHYVTSTVTVRAIDARAGQLLMVHAAGLAGPDGKVVGLIAPSGTGKTTLARTLGAHYGYVTDETLAVDLHGEVFPYPKPLSLVVEGGTGVKQQRSPDNLGMLRPPEGLRLSRLVVLNRIPDVAREPMLEQIPLLPGLADMAPHISYLPQLPDKLHDLARLTESVGGVWRLTYSDASSVVGLFPELEAA
ncbi:arsenate reductase/protein-tyrosine-phosphatase family protein [Demequina sediminicola]|uniref:arsenate reductase/protein-tyrosine-phosphatase family protein n=1 Tax=Demequina sediminicola TaxID=1095026 RepID=UPI0007812BC0|nr:hypothetical protein [Demequina sediminicola]